MKSVGAFDRRKHIGSLLVLLQFSLMGRLAFLGGPSLATGLAPVSAWVSLTIGLALGIWSLATNRPGNFNIRPTPRAQGLLVTTGPYHWIRHPMYSSVLLCAAGFSWAAPSTWPAWLTFVALAIVLILKSIVEENWLLEEQSGYASYRSRTKRFVPGIF
ncbi:MAG: isoprenylcysteine carboxylmethyltransferase family protein [Burkholderiaceae bacterium]